MSTTDDVFGDAPGAESRATARYVCLHGCGFATTCRREFERHRAQAGHRNHGVKTSQWPT